MESSLPFAVRVAAGLLSGAVGRARRLPADLTTLPVTVIGQVAKLSFELNQQLAGLATEGDRLLAGLHSDDAPPQRTAWSTIDDEDEVAAKDPQAAATWDTTGSPTPAADDAPPNPFGAPGLVLDDDPVPAPSPSPRLVPDEDAPTADSGTASTAEDISGTARKPSARTPSARRPRLVPDPDAPTPTGAATGAASTPASARRPRPAGRRVGTPGDSVGSRVTPAGPTPTGDVDGTRSLVEDVGQLEVERPAPLVGLPSAARNTADTEHSGVDISAMTIGQLRGRVRDWGSEQVRAALEQEQREKARPAFLTVLTNRLSTLARGGA